MAVEFIIKRSLDVLSHSGLARLFAPITRGIGVIFCLHHVRPQAATNFRPNYQLEITPEFLDVVIGCAVARGYRLISLDEAVTEIRSGAQMLQPFAVFTLDDGYRDNAEFAAPVFRARNCPYTIFVTPGIAEATTQLWWRDIELIADRKGRSLAEKQSHFMTLLLKAKGLGEDEQRAFVTEEARAAGLDQAAECRSVAMSWDEIRTLIMDPLCSIGAHTLNHFAMKRISAERVLTEMVQSKRIIERELQGPIRTFAYPYGAREDAGPRDFDLARDAGFEASVTTRKGVVFAEHAAHLQALPRLMVSGRYQSTRHIETLMSGVPFALAQKFRKLDIA